MRILFAVMLTISHIAMADEPTDQLVAHLNEMKAHLALVQKVDKTDYNCADLVERVKRMTHHMEMMTDMMVRMHASNAGHEMLHEKEGEEVAND